MNHFFFSCYYGTEHFGGCKMLIEFMYFVFTIVRFLPLDSLLDVRIANLVKF
jgi:hypothetical protein